MIFNGNSGVRARTRRLFQIPNSAIHTHYSMNIIGNDNQSLRAGARQVFWIPDSAIHIYIMYIEFCNTRTYEVCDM